MAPQFFFFALSKPASVPERCISVSYLLCPKPRESKSRAACNYSKLHYSFLLFPPRLCTCLLKEFPNPHRCPPAKAAFLRTAKKDGVVGYTCGVAQRKHDTSTNYRVKVSRAFSLLHQCRAACVTNHFSVRTCCASKRARDECQSSDKHCETGHCIYIRQWCTHTLVRGKGRWKEKPNHAAPTKMQCRSMTKHRTATPLTKQRAHFCFILHRLWVVCYSLIPPYHLHRFAKRVH